jgi:hypothetical protein
MQRAQYFRRRYSHRSRLVGFRTGSLKSCRHERSKPPSASNRTTGRPERRLGRSNHRINRRQHTACGAGRRRRAHAGQRMPKAFTGAFSSRHGRRQRRVVARDGGKDVRRRESGFAPLFSIRCRSRPSSLTGERPQEPCAPVRVCVGCDDRRGRTWATSTASGAGPWPEGVLRFWRLPERTCSIKRQTPPPAGMTARALSSAAYLLASIPYGGAQELSHCRGSPRP